MKITFSTTRPKDPEILCFVVPENDNPALIELGMSVTANAHISACIAAAKFKGKRDQTLDILAPFEGCARLVLFGAGEVAKLNLREVELIGGGIAGHLLALKATKATVLGQALITKTLPAHDIAATLASGIGLRNYKFDIYKTKKSDASKPLAQVTLHCENLVKTKAVYIDFEAVVDGVHAARDLVNEPANILHPVEFAKRVKALEKHGLKVEIITPSQMKKLGMGALLGVAQGSPFEPRIAIMRWDGGKKDEAPIAFVGKGVTFDTGGVSIKPAAGMEDMKGDMGGAAAVTGAMLALAKRKAKCNVIGVIGLVENAVDGAAQRPGDIVKSMSGQTIAVLNTDAEGRLVLADVCWYVQDRFKPKLMVDLATLTGAIMVALGKENAGLFSNDDDLAANLTSAGLATGEKVWRMPLSPEYDKGIDSDIADMKNIGTRFGGAITGAQFIQRFVNKVPWAHLDIAGTAMDGVKSPINQSWGSGWGVRLLNRLVADNYEK